MRGGGNVSMETRIQQTTVVTKNRERVLSGDGTHATEPTAKRASAIDDRTARRCGPVPVE